MSDDAFIRIDRVSRHFGDVRAVDNVALDIKRGEFFALLGPSGCGKTTLLRMIAGFESPTHGEIYIDGQPMADVPPNHRPTNMVFQSYAVFPHLTVRQNVGYGLRREKLDPKEEARRIDEALALVHLTGYDARKPNQLSGGQRQRVALARALIKRPKVLLLDEPLAALDKKLREEMQVELRALQKSVGITFVFVTHDQEEALEVADRVVLMNQGRIEQVGSPQEVWDHPASPFVYGFLGDVNLFHGRAHEGVLAAEVVVHLAVVHPGALGDVADARRPGTLLGQDVARGPHERRLHRLPTLGLERPARVTRRTGPATPDSFRCRCRHRAPPGIGPVMLVT